MLKELILVDCRRHLSRVYYFNILIGLNPFAKFDPNTDQVKLRLPSLWLQRPMVEWMVRL